MDPIDCGDALQLTLANTFMAAGFNWVGDITRPGGQLELKDGGLAKAGLHAVMGGLAAEALGGDFKTGALAAGVNELLVAELDAQYQKMGIADRKALLVMNAQLVGVLTAGLQGTDAQSLQVGSAVAGSATQYNYLFHAEIEQLLAKQESCKSSDCKREVAERYAELDFSRNNEINAFCESSPGTCDAILIRLAAEEPAVMELAKKAAREGDVGAALVIGASIGQSNSSAMQKIASELGANTEFQVALAELMKDGATGGLGRAGGIKSSAITGAGGAKATPSEQKPLVSKGSEVTPEIIQKALKGNAAISAQNGVSLPAVQRYVDRLLKGDVAPAIKMDGNVIVDGNHRYIAAKILGQSPAVVGGTLSPNKVGQTKPVSELKVDDVDWGNR